MNGVDETLEQVTEQLTGEKTFGDFLQKLSDELFRDGPLSALITTVLILLTAFLIDFFVRRAFRRSARRRPDSRTQLGFIKKVVRAVILLLAVYGVLMQFKPFGSVATTVLAGSGVAVLVVGLAAQEAMGNMVSGFFLSMSRPFSIGDRITLVDRNITGFVEDITLRHTVIRTFQNTRIIVPNSVMNQTVIDNARYGDERVSFFLDFSIGYSSDIDRAMTIISEETTGHPGFIDTRTEQQKLAGEPACPVRLTELADSGVTLRCVPTAKDAGAAYTMGCDLRLSVKKRFDAEGIEIPFPHRKVILEREEK